MPRRPECGKVCSRWRAVDTPPNPPPSTTICIVHLGPRIALTPPALRDANREPGPTATARALAQEERSAERSKISEHGRHDATRGARLTATATATAVVQGGG